MWIIYVYSLDRYKLDSTFDASFFWRIMSLNIFFISSTPLSLASRRQWGESHKFPTTSCRYCVNVELDVHFHLYVFNDSNLSIHNVNVRFQILIVYLITLELGVLAINFGCEKGRFCCVSINTKRQNVIMIHIWNKVEIFVSIGHPTIFLRSFNSIEMLQMPHVDFYRKPWNGKLQVFKKDGKFLFK